MESFDGPGDKGPGIRAGAICMIVLTTVAISLRVLARAVSKYTGFWADDYMALIAWALAIPLFAIYFPLVNHGFGQHIGHASNRDVHDDLVYLYITEIFYNLSLTFVKMSALLFYVRVFGMRQKWWRYSVFSVGFLVVGWGIYTVFGGAFKCSPPRKAWNPDLPGHCLPEYATYLAVAIPNPIIDFLILIMPMPLVKSLRLPLVRKIGLVLVFAFGYCVLGVSIARAVEVIQTKSKTSDEDFTWTFVTTYILVYLEVGIGLISVCLPAHVSLARYFGKDALHVPLDK